MDLMEETGLRTMVGKVNMDRNSPISWWRKDRGVPEGRPDNGWRTDKGTLQEHAPHSDAEVHSFLPTP